MDLDIRRSPGCCFQVAQTLGLPPIYPPNDIKASYIPISRPEVRSLMVPVPFPYEVKANPSDTSSFLIGLLIGTAVVGPIVWTVAGRTLAKAVVRKGVSTARPYVERLQEKLR